MYECERAEVIIKRTYSRWNSKKKQLESWDDIQGNRVYNHQKWLWERALGRELQQKEIDELDNFTDRCKKFMCSPSGRTNWMSDQAIGKAREIAHFNCAGEKTQTVYDIVDFYWVFYKAQVWEHIQQLVL